MRSFLDAIYRIALWLAAICLVMIAVLVLLQVLGRIADRLLLWTGADALGLAVPSLAEIGGFLFVAASCLAFAPTLRAGTHVRVNLIAGNVGEGAARVLDSLMLVGAAIIACFAAWHTFWMAVDAWNSASVSYGTIPVPLWIPQALMALGFVVLAVAVLDEFAAALRGITPAFRVAESARDVTEGGE